MIDGDIGDVMDDDSCCRLRDDVGTDAATFFFSSAADKLLRCNGASCLFQHWNDGIDEIWCTCGPHMMYVDRECECDVQDMYVAVQRPCIPLVPTLAIGCGMSMTIRIHGMLRNSYRRW